MPTARNNRRTATRQRHAVSCRLQFGTSGRSTSPCGGDNCWRAIGRAMSHTSRLTIDHMTMRALPGSFKGGRSTMAEYGARRRGSLCDSPTALTAKQPKSRSYRRGRLPDASRSHCCSPGQIDSQTNIHATIVVVGQRAQRGLTVSGERRSVHQRKGAWCQPRKRHGLSYPSRD